MNNTKDYASDILKGIFLLSYIYITLIAITYIKSEICGIPKYAIYIISAVIVCSVIIYMRKEKRYKVICCKCNKEIYATKSIFHEMGMFDLGHGRCLHCNTSLQLIYEPETETEPSR